MTGEQLSANLATAVRQWSTWIQEGLGRLPTSKIHNGICAVLVLWVLYGLVQLVVVFIPSPATESEAIAVGGDSEQRSPGPATANSPGSVDLAGLQALNIFGVAGAEPKPAAEPAPVVDEEAMNAAKTRLNLTLEGIVYSQDDTESVAVIVHQGKQEQFYIGDKIPAANGVTLARVLLDRVILDNNGKYESLWLYDDSKSPASSARTTSRRSEAADRVADMRSNEEVTDMAQQYRQQLYKNPASLAEVIRIAPQQKDGQLVGYRISPGKDREQFETLGLQPNDIVTSINGIALNEPSNALEIYKLMRSAKEASFTLDRGGQTVEIMVSLAGDE